VQEGRAQQEAAQCEAATLAAASHARCEALQVELDARPGQAEMHALRERVEALRLLVDSREEDGESTDSMLLALHFYTDRPCV
jgi:hypothetical protein